MKTPPLALLAVLLLCTAGCLISAQEGDRSHVNSPYPEEITFHFDTQFNKFLLFGRSAVLLFIPLWAIRTHSRAGSNMVPLILAVAAGAASIWLLASGWRTAFHYRVEVRTASLYLQIPGIPQQEIPWADIESLDVEGMARNVDMVGGGLEWAPEWEDLSLAMAGGRTQAVDLRPLSVEQRGNLWRAIVRKAGLKGQVAMPPPRHRQ